MLLFILCKEYICISFWNDVLSWSFLVDLCLFFFISSGLTPLNVLNWYKWKNNSKKETILFANDVNLVNFYGIQIWYLGWLHFGMNLNYFGSLSFFSFGFFLKQSYSKERDDHFLLDFNPTHVFSSFSFLLKFSPHLWTDTLGVWIGASPLSDELVACQRWFCCRVLAAAPLTPRPISPTSSCPWRRDGRTEGSSERKRGRTGQTVERCYEKEG